MVLKRASEAETDRTAKRAKLQVEIPDVTTLCQQLEAKTAECQSLNSKVNQMESEMMVQEQLSQVCTQNVFNKDIGQKESHFQ